MSPLEGLWAAETAGGGDCWAFFAYFFVFFAYFFVFFPLSAGRHNGTHVRPHNGPSTWPGTSAGLPRAGARDVPARPRPRQPSQEWSWGPASRRWYPPFRRFSDVFPTISRRTPGLPAASPFRGAAAPAFPLILRRAPICPRFGCRRRFAPARSRDRQGAPGYPRPCADDGICGVRGQKVCVRGKASSPGGLAPGLGGS